MKTSAPTSNRRSRKLSLWVKAEDKPGESVYGMEYIYSILERGRLAALSGDRLLAQPVILDVGYEAWRAKEAKAGDEFANVWGPATQQGPAWEALTATTYLQGGPTFW